MLCSALFGLLFVSLICINGDTQQRSLIWQPNTEGLFSQFLQVKIMLYFANNYERELLVSPFRTLHFDKSILNICDVFYLPQITCIMKNCKGSVTKVTESILSSTQSKVCLKDSIPSIGGETRRDSFLHGIKLLHPKFIISHSFDDIIRLFQTKLNILNNNGTIQPYTAVHWRRGDQLTSRCVQNKDSSVNCLNATDLITLIQRLTNHSLVYIATNEPNNSTELITLKNAGYKVFSSANLLNVDSRSLTALILDASVMLGSDTFLAWGVSIANDVIEHERMLNGQSYCVAHSSDVVVYPTWCWLHEQEKLLKQRHQTTQNITRTHHQHHIHNTKSSQINFNTSTYTTTYTNSIDNNNTNITNNNNYIPFTPLSHFNTSHMTAYQLERRGKYSRKHGLTSSNGDE